MNRVESSGGFLDFSAGGLYGIRSGFGLLAGVNAGFRITEGVWLTLTPEVGIGRGGELLYFAQLGLQVGF